MHSLTPRPAAAGLQVGTGFHGRRAFPVVSCGGSVGLPYDMVVGIQEHFQLLLVRKELISRPQLTQGVNLWSLATNGLCSVSVSRRQIKFVPPLLILVFFRPTNLVPLRIHPQTFYLIFEFVSILSVCLRKGLSSLDIFCSFDQKYNLIKHSDSLQECRGRKRMAF